jgi:uncharacterized protein with beta-barrel porin domain
MWRRVWTGATAGLVTVLGFMLSATGQGHADDLINGDLQGTTLQVNTGIGVQTACGGFLANPDETRTSLESALFTRCGEMVHTFRSLRGQDNADPDLVLESITTEEELAAALQQIAGEETLSPGSMATEAARDQFTGIAARLAALRVGAMGFTIAGLPSTPADPSNYATTLDVPATSPVRGGAASADQPELVKDLGGFVNLVGGLGDKDATDLEDGFDYNAAGITAGVDYRVSDRLVLGVAFGYNSVQTDFDERGTVTGGGIDNDNYAASLYGSYSAQDYYIDGIVTYGWSDYDMRRRVYYDVQNKVATADTESDQYSLAVGAGYEAHKGALSFGPQVRVSYLNLDIDGYEESGAEELNLAVDDQEVESLTTAVGGQVAYTISHKLAVIRPFATAEWHHEFDDDSQVISTHYVNDPRQHILELQTDDPDRNYFLVGAGISGVLPGGAQASLSYDTVLGLDDVTSHTFTLAARLEF